MSPDIVAATKLLKEEKIWNSVRMHMDNYHSSQDIETRVFSPSTYTLGEDRPAASDSGSGKGKKRKTSEGAAGKKDGGKRQTRAS